MESRYRGYVTRIEDGWVFIDSPNKDVGRFLVLLQDIRLNGTKKLEINDTVAFSMARDAANRFKAINVEVIDRNVVEHSTEDKNYWLAVGESSERAFVKDIAPKINRTLIINPEKITDPTAIDLYNPIQKYYADLKSPRTPFFTAFTYGFDPNYTVTFNKKDYVSYKKLYPGAIIYWHVKWNQSSFRNLKVDPLEGVWEVPFSYMAKLIEEDKAPLHAYQNRKTDEVNAQESYLFNLNDFEKLL